MVVADASQRRIRHMCKASSVMPLQSYRVSVFENNQRPTNCLTVMFINSIKYERFIQDAFNTNCIQAWVGKLDNQQFPVSLSEIGVLPPVRSM